ncbi:MAG TPA: DUF2147 domain-containing protein [Burkholderiaceae bacterium]
MMRRTPHLVAALVLGLYAALAHAQATPAGVWKTIDDNTGKEKSLIRITESNGVYTGKLEKLLDPATKPDAVCEKCSDDRKDKPLLGMTLIKGVRQIEGDKDVWGGGEILDPNNGKTYKVRLTPADGGKRLKVRGYIGMPLLGRTQTWIRVD